jgi:hypothetical protein
LEKRPGLSREAWVNAAIARLALGPERRRAAGTREIPDLIAHARVQLRLGAGDQVPIRRVTLERVDVHLPADEAEVRGLLQELPRGFIRNPDFGLGVEKEFGSIITSIEKLDGVISLVLTNRRQTGRDENIFFLTFGDFEDVRLAMARITRRYQAKGRVDRAILAHNEILTKLTSPGHIVAHEIHNAVDPAVRQVPAVPSSRQRQADRAELDAIVQSRAGY